MAFALAVLHLGVLAVRKFYDLHDSRDLKFVLEIFWGLWLVMPLLVGCAAVAEERKLGTLEGQLCLPAKRRTQFAVKFFVVLGLSVLFGMVMPLLLEGTRIFGEAHIGPNFSTDKHFQMSVGQMFFWNCVTTLNIFLPMLTLAVIAALIGGISFYASSLARNTLQSLAPAVLGLLLMWCLLFAAAVPWAQGFDFLWRGPLAFFIAVPLVLLTLLGLAFWNFQQVRPGAKSAWGNLLALILALLLGVGATSAIYHRAWEKLTPFEPPHGAARLALANPPALSNDRGAFVRLPGGEIRLLPLVSIPESPNPLSVLLGNFKVVLGDSQFINGSNWVSVHRSGLDAVGLKTDGTLWVSEKTGQRGKLRNGQWRFNPVDMNHLVQFGTETNWSSFVSVGFSTLLVKNDGTLWRWGVREFDWNHQTWPGLRTFTPHQLGTESNWAEVFQINYQMGLRKLDGSGWATGNDWQTNGLALIEIEPGLVLHSAPGFNRGTFRSRTMISHGLQFMTGISTDGTFRIYADEQLNHARYGNYVWTPVDLQLGQETNWLAVAGGWEGVVTLKDDGTLWQWNFRDHSFHFRQTWNPENYEREVQHTRPIQLGTHADWIAIASGNGDVIALAADGNLWFWPLSSWDDYYNNRGFQEFLPPLLDISRKPQLLGNIFSAAK
jgi:alpha-tubulin suppressor-like RCC1 family protein/ABC-type transport system involved in multi-copper enzyme maturation permease subunit